MSKAVPVVVGLVSGLTTIFGAVDQYKAQEKAEDEAREAKNKAKAEAAKNAELIQKETEEEIRRKKVAREQDLGTLRAKLGASLRGASPQAYISGFLAERDKEIEWIKTTGKSQSDIARSSYSSAGYSGPSVPQFLSTLASGGAQGYSWYEKYIK